MITPKDIERKTMNPTKREEAKNSFFAFYVGRPLSYILTIPCLYMNIAPNAVTIFSILCAFIGFGCLSFGNTLSMHLVGFLFIFLWNMGDGVDGNIARYKKLKSSTGDMLDTLGGYLAMSLIVLGMGNAACCSEQNILILPRVILIILAELSAVFNLVPRLLMHRKLAMNRDTNNASALKDKKNYGLLKIIALNLCDPAGFQEVIMLVCIILGWCGYFTIFYFIMNFAMMLYSLKNLCD